MPCEQSREGEGLLRLASECGDLRRCQRVSDLVHDRGGRVPDVRECEAKQAETGVEQLVLPTVCPQLGSSVRTAVVLNGESMGGVVEIHATEEAIIAHRAVKPGPRAEAVG